VSYVGFHSKPTYSVRGGGGPTAFGKAEQSADPPTCQSPPSVGAPVSGLPSSRGGQRQWLPRDAVKEKVVQDARPKRRAKSARLLPRPWRERDRWSSGGQSAAEGGGAKRWPEEDRRFLSLLHARKGVATPTTQEGYQSCTRTSISASPLRASTNSSIGLSR